METENLMLAKDSKKDQEEQMPRRWEVPCFLRNTVFVMGTKQRGRWLNRARLWKAPRTRLVDNGVLGWGRAMSSTRHRDGGQASVL